MLAEGGGSPKVNSLNMQSFGRCCNSQRCLRLDSTLSMYWKCSVPPYLVTFIFIILGERMFSLFPYKCGFGELNVCTNHNASKIRSDKIIFPIFAYLFNFISTQYFLNGITFSVRWLRAEMYMSGVHHLFIFEGTLMTSIPLHTWESGVFLCHLENDFVSLGLFNLWH